MTRHSVLERLPRALRRRMMDEETRARRTGAWGAWEHTVIDPAEIGGDGWTLKIERAHRNKVFCVLDRPLGDGGRHFAISSFSQIRPTWREAQRIKNELAGEDATAIEIYPPAGEVIDAADMYHLWVLPGEAPYSLWHDE